jgi:hypothetical protein
MLTPKTSNTSSTNVTRTKYIRLRLMLHQNNLPEPEKTEKIRLTTGHVHEDVGDL